MIFYLKKKILILDFFILFCKTYCNFFFFFFFDVLQNYQESNSVAVDVDIYCNTDLVLTLFFILLLFPFCYSLFEHCMFFCKMASFAALISITFLIIFFFFFDEFFNTFFKKTFDKIFNTFQKIFFHFFLP